MGSEGGVHELLRGGGKPYSNTMSKRQMAVLAAICDTFLPAMTATVSESRDADAIAEFFGTSASMAGVPEHVAGMLSGRLKHPATKLLRLQLWLLSSPWGSLAICGHRSMSRRFPYFQDFPKIDQKEREKILHSWCFSSFSLYNMAFRCLKSLIAEIYFTKVDENNHNPAWRALDYCGPDPRSSARVNTVGHLDEHLIDGSDPERSIIEAFRHAGFTSSTAPSTVASSPLTIRCDAVVVGSGSGGSVVAGVLAKEGGYKVVVVEKGRFFRGCELSLLEGPSMDEMYESSGLLATDDVKTLVLAGATVGGGSAINWAASLRTPVHVTEEWRVEHGLELFGSDRFRRALDAVCQRMGVQSNVHEEGFNGAVLRRGCEALGYPVVIVPRNAPQDHKCGWCHLGCKEERKQSTNQTWLADMALSGNGVILQNSKAIKVLTKRSTKGKRGIATGVLVELGTSKRTIMIESRVTVVAGGALNTPPLLRRSKLRNKHIGRHLHMHPCTMAWGYFPENGSWPEKHKKSYDGPILTSMSTVVANFDSTGYGAIIQTPAIHPGTYSVLTPWLCPLDFRNRLLHFPRTTHLFALARDRGSGSSVSYPKSLTYKMDTADQENLRQGVEAMLRILVAAGAKVVGTHHAAGKVFDVPRGGREELEKYVKEESERATKGIVCSAHQMGSCRMGRDKSVAAVNPDGETWEVARLFVADTSIFPTAVGVNPMVTVQAIAYCTAGTILERLREWS